LSENIKYNNGPLSSFSGVFQEMQINFIFDDNIFCVYPAVKKSITTDKLSEKSTNKSHSNHLHGWPFSFLCLYYNSLLPYILHESGTRKYLL